MKSLKIKIGMTKSFLKMYEKYVDKGIMRNTLDLEKDVKEAVLEFEKVLQINYNITDDMIFKDLLNDYKKIFGDWEK